MKRFRDCVNSNGELWFCLRWMLAPIEVRNHADTEGFADGSDCENESKEASRTVGGCYREASFGKCLADILKLGIAWQCLQFR